MEDCCSGTQHPASTKPTHHSSESKASASEKDTKLEEASEQDHPESPRPLVRRLAALWSPKAHQDPLWRALTAPEPPKDLPALWGPDVEKDPPPAIIGTTTRALTDPGPLSATAQAARAEEVRCGGAEEVPTGKLRASSEPEPPNASDVSDVKPQNEHQATSKTSSQGTRAARGTLGCFGGRYPPKPVEQPEKYAEFLTLKTGYAEALHDQSLLTTLPIGSRKADNSSGAQSRYCSWVSKRVKLLKSSEAKEDLEHKDWVSQAVEDWRTSCLGLAPRSCEEAAAAATARAEEKAKRALPGSSSSSSSSPIHGEGTTAKRRRNAKDSGIPEEAE